MIKTLNGNALMITGRQSEMIELSLTFKFDQLDIDLADMVARTNRTDLENASRFIKSANIQIGGYDLSIDLDAGEVPFGTAIGKLPASIDVGASVGATLAMVEIPATTLLGEFDEASAKIAERIGQVAKILEEKGQKLALRLVANVDAVKEDSVQFITDVAAFTKFVKSLSFANVGILLETWQWTVGGGSLKDLADFPADKIYGVRCADLPADVDAAAAKGTDVLLPFETDTIDNVAYLEHLTSVGFDGPLSAAGNPIQIEGNKRDAIVTSASKALDRLIDPDGFVATQAAEAAARAEAAGEEDSESGTSEKDEEASASDGESADKDGAPATA